MTERSSPDFATLLPCPFCAADCAELSKAMGESWVRCPHCHASGGMSGSSELAVKNWNARVSGVAASEPKVVKVYVKPDGEETFVPPAQAAAPQECDLHESPYGWDCTKCGAHWEDSADFRCAVSRPHSRGIE